MLASDTYEQWYKHKAPRLSAALAFYTVLSLSPLLSSQLTGGNCLRTSQRDDQVKIFRYAGAKCVSSASAGLKAVKIAESAGVAAYSDATKKENHHCATHTSPSVVPAPLCCRNGDIVMLMLTRRTAMLAPLGAAAIPATPARAAAGGKMSLSLHQTTSLGAGFRKSLEGWSKAGIKNVEINDLMLDEFLKTDTLAAARTLLKDLGLTVVSSSARQVDLYIPGPTQVTALEGWKKR
jgi:hypothetical protein